MNVHPFFRLRKDERGLSLIELVVVIAIMAAMVGLLSLGLGMLFSKDAERSAKLIDDQLSETRLSAMSKQGTFVMKIHTTAKTAGGKGNYIEVDKSTLPLAAPGEVAPAVTTTTTHTDIDRKVYITFGKKDALPTDPTDDTLEISFDKADGHVTDISNSAGSLELNSVIEIKCTTPNNSRSKSLYIMPVTGRHYIE